MTPDHVLADARWLRENYDEGRSAQFLGVDRVQAVCAWLLALEDEYNNLRELVGLRPRIALKLPPLAPRGTFKAPHHPDAPVVATLVRVERDWQGLLLNTVDTYHARQVLAAAINFLDAVGMTAPPTTHWDAEGTDCMFFRCDPFVLRVRFDTDSADAGGTRTKVHTVEVRRG